MRESAAVRLRQASRDDAAFLAWVMLAASRSHLERGLWEYLLDRPEAPVLGFLEDIARSEAVHWCHHSRFLVAEVDGEPGAALCGFDPTLHGPSALGPALSAGWRKLGFDDRDLAGVVARGGVVQEVNPAYAEGAWVVENVATRPEHRRRGLVDALLGAVLERGRTQGFSLAQISLLIGNEPARRAYRKHGFRFLDEKRADAFEAALGSPGIERRLRRLGTGGS